MGLAPVARVGVLQIPEPLAVLFSLTQHCLHIPFACVKNIPVRKKNGWNSGILLALIATCCARLCI